MVHREGRGTVGDNSVDALVAEATQRIDSTEEVLAAGRFQVQSVGAAVGGGLIGSTLGGGSTGNVIGLMAGEKAYAESRGLTEQVLVAVTATHVLLLNGDTADRLPHLGAAFDRSTCKINVKSFGPILSLHFEDPEGHKLKLNGSTLVKADRAVEALLRT